MKKRFFHNTLLSFALISGVLSSNGAEPRYDYKFSENTPLESGRWVKFSINETGLYEITYDQLKAMGFSDPSKVALFGTGGGMLDYNFTDSKGVPKYSDVPVPATVLHTGNKIIFYGVGTETMSAATLGYANKRYRHRRLSKNVYSDKSYYLLTDSREPLTPESNPVSDKSNAVDVAYGYGCEYHEKDLRHNEYMEGQVFWGEEAYLGKPLNFPIDKKYCYDAPSFVWLEYINTVENGGYVECSLGGSATTSEISNMPSNVYTLGSPDSNMHLTVNADNHRGTSNLAIGVTGAYPAGSPLAVDYWTLSYPVSLLYARNDNGFTSQYMAFPEVSGGKWKHPVPENTIVWDITGRQNPKALDVADGNFYSNARYTSQVIAFNPDRTQLSINPDWKVIENQNLHSLQQEPVSMIIITLPHLKVYAERIASLHELHGDGRVVVATPEEIYNEFNHGTPDVTALRAFVKMMYHAQREVLKNVLLIGNIYADYRNIDGHSERPDGLPVYMIPKVNLKKAEGAEGSASTDYIGIMTDYMNATGMLGNVGVELGVGLLPISSFEEGEIAVKKIGDYLEREDFSNLVNEFMTICDEGDSHIHDFQAFKLANLYNTYADEIAGSQFAVSPLWSEQMGFKKVKDTALMSLRRGKLLTTYYGHAGNSDFGQLTFQDFMRLENEEPAFFFMAACDLCEPDRMHHGIGDLGVIRNTKGLMATICATRSVLSHENQALSENFANAMFYDKTNQARTETATMGELYAQAKTMTNNVSKQAYLLIGDPALPLPLAYGKVNITPDRSCYRGDEVMEVTGEVLNSNGEIDTDYNGYATIKLMEPRSEKAIVADPVDDNGTIVPNPRLVINDYRLASVRTKVKDGKFNARLKLPAKLDNFLSTPDSTRTLGLFVGTYNPETRSASSGHHPIVMPMLGSSPDESALHDTQAPAVTASHDEFLNLLTIDVTDDTGIACSNTDAPVTLHIDGKKIEVNPEMAKDMVSDFLSVAVSTAHLASGSHTATVSATDVAGNVSNPINVRFNITESKPFLLTVSSAVATDEVTLSAGNVETAELIYVISDRNGKIVESAPFDEKNKTIDLTDYAAGTYRAAVKENSPRGTKIFSNWVEFTKID